MENQEQLKEPVSTNKDLIQDSRNISESEVTEFEQAHGLSEAASTNEINKLQTSQDKPTLIETDEKPLSQVIDSTDKQSNTTDQSNAPLASISIQLLSAMNMSTESNMSPNNSLSTCTTQSKTTVEVKQHQQLPGSYSPHLGALPPSPPPPPPPPPPPYTHSQSPKIAPASLLQTIQASEIPLTIQNRNSLVIQNPIGMPFGNNLVFLPSHVPPPPPPPPSLSPMLHTVIPTLSSAATAAGAPLFAVYTQVPVTQLPQSLGMAPPAQYINYQTPKINSAISVPPLPPPPPPPPPYGKSESISAMPLFSETGPPFSLDTAFSQSVPEFLNHVTKEQVEKRDTEASVIYSKQSKAADTQKTVKKTDTPATKHKVVVGDFAINLQQLIRCLNSRMQEESNSSTKAPFACVLLTGLPWSGKTTVGKELTKLSQQSDENRWEFLSGGDYVSQVDRHTHNTSKTEKEKENYLNVIKNVLCGISGRLDELIEISANKDNKAPKGVIIDRNIKTISDLYYFLHLLYSKNLRLDGVILLDCDDVGQLAKVIRQRMDDNKSDADTSQSIDAIQDKVKYFKVLMQNLHRGLAKDVAVEVVNPTNDLQQIVQQSSDLLYKILKSAPPANGGQHQQQRMLYNVELCGGQCASTFILDYLKYLSVMEELSRCMHTLKPNQFPGYVNYEPLCSRKDLGSNSSSSAIAPKLLNHHVVRRKPYGMRAVLFRYAIDQWYLIPRRMQEVFRIESNILGQSVAQVPADATFVLDGELVVCNSTQSRQLFLISDLLYWSNGY